MFYLGFTIWKAISQIEVFPRFQANEFISKYTKFDSYKGFMDQLPGNPTKEKDIDDIQDNKINKFIQEKSKFKNWNELYQAAAKFYAERKLKQKE